MAEAPSVLVVAIITAMVIVVVGLLLYTLVPETADQITSIADQVFHSEEIAKEEVQSLTALASESFLSDTDQCSDSKDDGCLCFLRASSLPEGSYFIIQNKEKESTVTVLTKEDTPLSQEDHGYQVGLFVIKKEGQQAEMGCVFPDQFTIVGENGGAWSIEWNNDVYHFYRNAGTSDRYGAEMNAKAPLGYKVDENKLCLVTNVLEEDTVVSGLSYASVKEIEVKQGPTILGHTFDGTVDWGEVTDFFAREKVSYCSYK